MRLFQDGSGGRGKRGCSIVRQLQPMMLNIVNMEKGNSGSLVRVQKMGDILIVYFFSTL